jgi:type VI secretion system secreted protein Hcp
MASEIFLNLGKDYEGESKGHDHENEIDVLSFSLGASNTSSVGTGSGSGTGKVDISSLSIQKLVDKSSPLLFLACCQGDHIAEAKMTVREAGGKTAVEYYILEMKEVFVNGVSWGGAEGGGKPTESCLLSFAEMKVTYYPQDEKGAKMEKSEAAFNIKKNKAA